eukprot:scaffold326697_cov62-Tisochrysis_lutea.AAC.1
MCALRDVHSPCNACINKHCSQQPLHSQYNTFPPHNAHLSTSLPAAQTLSTLPVHALTAMPFRLYGP